VNSISSTSTVHQTPPDDDDDEPRLQSDQATKQQPIHTPPKPSLDESIEGETDFAVARRRRKEAELAKKNLKRQVAQIAGPDLAT